MLTGPPGQISGNSLLPPARCADDDWEPYRFGVAGVKNWRT
jgi:hypothetical protein